MKYTRQRHKPFIICSIGERRMSRVPGATVVYLTLYVLFPACLKR